MSRVGRLAGALLVETEGRYFLVGNTKEPCDFPSAGFAPPAEIDALKRPYLPLSVAGPVSFAPPWLLLGLEGEALARLVAERFLIERNGSVSDRLWRLVVQGQGERGGEEAGAADRGGELGGEEDGAAERGGEEDGGGQRTDGAVGARWLGEMPAAIWGIVRDTVLRCT